MGRSPSKFGFYECVEVKHAAWDRARLRDVWWHPYDESLARGVRAYARLAYGDRADRLRALRDTRALARLARKALRR